MYKKIFFIIVIIITISFTLTPAVTLAAAPFYEGKTIRFIVGFPPGGGYDIHARVMARHIVKHIPGNPTIYVDNMPGAGSLVFANYLYNIAKPDGLTFGFFNGTFLFNKTLGQEGLIFDPKKFIFIGSPEKATALCVLSKASGITNLNEWITSKKVVKFGGVSQGTVVQDNCPRILKEVLGLPIQLVSGYKGTADIRLAVESGEVSGCFMGWDILSGPWRRVMERGDLVILLQAQPKPVPELSHIPLAIDLAKTDEARQLILIGIHFNLAILRPLVLPPGTPIDRVQILRNAFQETIKDNGYTEDVEKAKLGFDPIIASEIENAVEGISKISPAILAKLKEILLK